MKVIFKYNLQKDVWCLLNKGKSSNNSQQATKVYQQLVNEYGENPTEESATFFVQKYLSNNAIDVEECASKYQKDWDITADDYHKRAEQVFGVTLPTDVTGYLTVNNRCPYNIAENWFFVAVPTASARKTTMHELWHFYTWQKFGADWEEKLGKQKYNDIKESLTVLLNVECRDLLPEGVTDNGYPQHKELREKILKTWSEIKNMEKLWNTAAEYWDANSTTDASPAASAL